MMMSFVKNADIGFGRDREQNTHTHTPKHSHHTHFVPRLQPVGAGCGQRESLHFKHADHHPGSDPHLGGFGCSVGVGSKALKKPNTLPPTPAHTHTHTAGRSGKTKATAGVLTLPEANSAAFISPLLLL